MDFIGHPYQSNGTKTRLGSPVNLNIQKKIMLIVDYNYRLTELNYNKYQPTFVILIAHGAPGNPEIDITLMLISKAYKHLPFTES